MFARHRLRDELGDLVVVHRPVNPFVAWAVLLALSSPFAILFALGPPGPLVGLAIFLGFLLPLGYMFGEWILLQHRVYQHGIVFRSVPGLRTYVIPFYCVDPERIEVTGRYQVPRGQFRLAQPEHRESPFVQTSLRLAALSPRQARRLAGGKLDWREAGAEAVAQREAPGTATDDVADWRASFRDPQRYRQLLHDTAVASQHTDRDRT